MKRSFLIVPMLLLSATLLGQDMHWWNVKHGWNGTQHWREFLTLSSKFMGPNALPVTPLRTGSIPALAELEMKASGHFSEGDNTQDLASRLYIPVMRGAAGLEINWVGVEHFKNDTTTRDLRGSRERDGEGISVGDVWITTFITLMESNEKRPDILLAINLKTASGTNLHAARFTDTPGYSFDLSVGKKMKQEESARYFRPMAMAGFYAWQTFSIDENQDDAFLYGVGSEWGGAKFYFRAGIRGYIGYRNNGDRPMVSSVRLGTIPNGRTSFVMEMEGGIFDYDYFTTRLSLIYQLQRNKTITPVF